MNKRRPIMVMAGGTGGHVFPALAVADILRARGEDIVWMGTRSGIEARLVPQAGFPIEWLKVQGLRGKGLMTTALAPFKLLQACWQAMTILLRHKPRAVLGLGGFASGPGGLMAWSLRIPLVIHEQNAVIGLTNRVLSRLARISYFAFPQAATGRSNSQVVGNPVRESLLAVESPQQRLQKRIDQPRLNLLVVGGSLGARALNQVVPTALATLDESERPQVRHQCGARHADDCRQQYRSLSVQAEISEFIDDMTAAYEWADLVVCRSGALTVAELSATGSASILVPYPYAVDDHQYYNAAFLADAEAALRVREEDFTTSWLADRLRHFHQHRQAVVSMAVNARSVAFTDAAEQVAEGVLREAKA